MSIYIDNIICIIKNNYWLNEFKIQLKNKMKIILLNKIKLNLGILIKKYIIYKIN